MRRTLAAAAFIVMGLSFPVYSAYAEQAFCSLQDGQLADGKTVFEKQGKKYQFCCSGCLQRFKEAPEKFVSELQTPLPKEPVSAETACSTVCSD